MNIHTPRRYEKRIIYNKYLQFLCKVGIATVLSIYCIFVVVYSIIT